MIKMAGKPGSHEARRQARKLKCSSAADGRWIAWGGKSQHEVVRSGSGFKCSCRMDNPTNTCPHVVKVQIELGVFQ